MKLDTRLSGDAAEFVLASVLRNQYGIITQRFNVEGFDLIAFDTKNSKFKEGTSPFYIQVRTRGAGMTGFGKNGKQAQKSAIWLSFSGFDRILFIWQWDFSKKKTSGQSSSI